MRRCGRASCPLLVGLLTAAITAAGAIAAPDGNGKDHAGQGLALAKGHAKHAAATPQAPQAQAEPAKPAAPEHEKNESARPLSAAKSAPAPKSPPGVERRAGHLTICHRTGSGRYIVISPSVTGATNGHLKHHDDLVYTGSCTQSAQTPPDDPPAEPLATGEHPPRDPASRTGSAAPSASPSGDLPFTGFRTLYLFFAGCALLASGLALLRQKPGA